MSQPSLVAAFEQACRDAQVPSTRAAAEESLKSFFSHPDAISIALTVAESTTSSLARFHAAAALHSAARDRWVSLQPGQRYGQSSLRYWVINHVMGTPSLLTFERRALLRTAAFLTRRAYLEENHGDRDAFFISLEHTVTSRDVQQHVAVAAIEMIDLIAEEFLTPSLSRTETGIEREIFARARDEFAAPNGNIICLLRSASASLSMLLSADPIAFSPKDLEARFVPALSTVVKIITTDTKSLPLSKNDNVLLSEPDGSGTDNLDLIVINRFVDSEWVPIIDHIPALVKICFSITALQLSKGDICDACQVLSRATQIIVAIAAISRKSYEYSHASAQDVLTGLLMGMDQQKWCSCHIELVRIAYAEVWKRISCVYGLQNVESLPEDWIMTFTKDTCRELDFTAIRLSNPEGNDDLCSMDAVDTLMEAWSNFAVQGDDGTLTEHRLSSCLEDIISRFMRTFLRTSGKDVAIYAYAQQLNNEEDLGFEDTSIDDSRLCVAASMTRFVLHRLAGQIRHSLMNIAHRVFNWSSGQTKLLNTLSVFQEDLFFLIHFTCAILADEPKGEVPSIPDQFVRSMNGSELKTCTNPGTHVQTLLHAVMEVAEGETYLISQRGIHSVEASPRVGTAILDGLSRLCRTYFVPGSVSSLPNIAQLVGGDRFLDSSIIVCFEKATESLLCRGFEKDVAESAADLVSHLAAGARSFRSIRESKYWYRLLGQGVKMYQTLPSRAVQEMGRSLTTVLGDIMVGRLLLPAYDALRGFACAKDSLADAAERAIATLNLLGGAARSEQMESRTRQTLLQSLETPDGVAASCARSFSRNRPDVSRSVISLADTIVYSSLSLLHGGEADGLITNAIKLIALHSDIVGNQKGELSVDEIASDTKEMLALLTHIMEEAVGINAGDACYYGLSKVVSIMNDMLLDLPQVATPYFFFVTQLVCHYPEKLPSLPPDLCKQILQTIEMQISSMDVMAERRGLDAIAALGWAWVSGKTHGTGREALGEALRGFVGSIFNGIATGAAHTFNLDAAADAMLPLMHIKISGSMSVMEELAQALLESSGRSDQVRTALEELARAGSDAGSTYEGGISNGDTLNRRSLHVKATKSFREAVMRFSSSARNALISLALGQTVK